MLTIEQVETFHRVFGHPIKDSKEYLKHFETWPMASDGTRDAIKLRELRTNLIEEECMELKMADSMLDPVEYADALFDLLYVTFGAIIALGVPRKIGDEVQRSNMSKGVRCSYCVGTGDIPDPTQDTGFRGCSECDGQSIIAIKREDGKILKGPNFSPPDIRSIIEAECRDWDKDADHAST